MVRQIVPVKGQDDICEPVYCDFSIYHITEHFDTYSHIDTYTFFFLLSDFFTGFVAYINLQIRFYIFYRMKTSILRCQL